MRSGKAVDLALGTYPDFSLAEARDEARKRREETAKALDKGDVPPLMEIRSKAIESRTGATFEEFYSIFREKKGRISSEGFMKSMDSRMKHHVLPFIGMEKLNDITFDQLRVILERLERRDLLETGKKVRGYLSQLFRYAKIKGHITPERCTTLTDLSGILTAPLVVNHPAIIDPIEFGTLIRKISEDTARSISVYYALNILPHVFLRASSLTDARWSEVDFDKGVWIIPKERMKGKEGKRRELIVPLSRQVKGLLQALKARNLSNELIFPQSTYGVIKQIPISSVSMGNALKALGYEGVQTAHGFRASFRTIGSEVLGFGFEEMELQLHHLLKNAPNGFAYNRVSLLDRRKDMMQRWSDYLNLISG